jgi:hypothetical protein
LIADVGNVSKNILKLESSYIKRLHQDQKFVSVARKYLINGAWIMIMKMILLGVGFVSLAILA